MGWGGRGEAHKLVQVWDLEFRQSQLVYPHLDSNLRQNISVKNFGSVLFIIKFYVVHHQTVWPSGKLAALDTKDCRFDARWCIPYCNFWEILNTPHDQET